MATLFDFHAMVPHGALQPGGCICVPIIARTPIPRYRIRDIRLCSVGMGSWPSHTEKEPELYVILSGEVIYQTPGARFVVRAGMGIFFETGDSHATEIPQGIVSLGINLIEVPSS